MSIIAQAKFHSEQGVASKDEVELLSFVARLEGQLAALREHIRLSDGARFVRISEDETAVPTEWMEQLVELAALDAAKEGDK